MMKRRWSNNGGFSLRILEESSSEVTSSSALGMSPAVAMSPTSIGSAEYNDTDVWGYEDAAYGTPTAAGVMPIPTQLGCNGGIAGMPNGGVGAAMGIGPNVNTIHNTIQQAFANSLPGLQMHDISARSTSVNSISPGNND